MRAQTWIGVVVAAGIAGGAVWWLAAGGASAPSVETVGVEGSEAAGAAPGAARLGVAAPASRGEKGPAPIGRGSIAGTVRHDGKPVAAKVHAAFRTASEGGAREGPLGASLRPPEEGRGPVREATAGLDGAYVVEGAPAGSAWVAATTADGAVGFAEVDVPEGGSRVKADLVVEARGETLRGRVVHADGRPWKGRLGVQRQPIDELRALAGVPPLATDDAGRFVVTGLAPGDVSVAALEPDVMLVIGPTVRVPTSEEYVLTVDAGLFVVKGRVVRAEDGAGVGGAEVSCRTGGATNGWFAAKADEEGRFTVGASGGQSRIQVRAAGYVERTIDDAVSDDGKELVVRLSRTARLRGRVVGRDGGGVDGVSVFAERERQKSDGWTIGEPASGPSARTDAEGRYAFDSLEAGEFRVYARGGGWMSAEFAEKTEEDATPRVAIAAGKESVVDLVVVKAPRIVGDVLDAAGSRAAGARIETRLHEGNRMRIVFGQGADGAGRHAGGVPAVVCGADGAFVVDGVLPGVEYDLVATAPGSPAGNASSVVPGMSGDTRIEIRLPKSRWVEVSVVDAATGAGIAEATVSVSVRKEREASEVSDGFSMPDIDFGGRFAHSWSTDASGHVRAGPLGPGSLEVSVASDEYVTPAGSQPVEGSDARDDGLTATVRLERGEAISGTVLMPDGSPADNVYVSARAESGQSMRDRGEATGAGGSFRLAGIPKGRYEVKARTFDDRGLTASATADTGTTGLVLRLSDAAGARIVVRVLDPAGAPVPRASAEFSYTGANMSGSSGGQVKDGRAVSTGEQYAGVVEVTVVVSDARTADGTPLPLGRTRLTGLKPGQEYVLRMNPELTITGRVVGPDGKPVAKATVKALVPSEHADDEPDEDLPWADEDGSTTTDADGAFRLGGLGEGRYSVSVSPPPAFVKPPSARTTAGAAGVVVSLRAAAPATVTVVDVDGRAVAGARVTTQREQAGGNSARFYFSSTLEAKTTGAEGRLALPNLDPAMKYLLRVAPPVSRGDLAGARLAGWSPGDVTVRLERGQAVSGVLRDAAGAPLAGVGVECTVKGEGGEAYRIKTGQDGSFRFGGLRAGPVELSAQEGEGPRAPRAVVSATAPAAGVVLVLDRGAVLTVRVENIKEFADDWAEASISQDGVVFASDTVQAGEVRFVGLSPTTTYTVWIGPDAAGRAAYVQGVRPGTEAVVAKLQVGKTITGRVIAPAGVKPESVGVNERGVVVSAAVAADGTFKIVGLPEGTWKVTTDAEVGQVVYAGIAEAAAGGTVELKVEPRK